MREEGGGAGGAAASTETDTFDGGAGTGGSGETGEGGISWTGGARVGAGDCSSVRGEEELLVVEMALGGSVVFEELRLMSPMGVPAVGLLGIGKLELEALAREEGSPRPTAREGGVPRVN